MITALDLDSGGLQPAEMAQLQSLVAEFADVFALDSTELGRTSITTHEINTGDSHHAVFLSPYGARWIVHTTHRVMGWWKGLIGR